MDFAWVVDALRRGLKVTRKAWAGDPPMYLYMVTEKKPNGKHIIKMRAGNCPDFEWTTTAEQMITVDDWTEYVEPKKDIQLRSATGETIKVAHEEIPVWPDVNADGYARMSKDSDVIVHDLVYRPKKEPVKDGTDQQLHIGDKKPTFQDLCDVYLSQEEGTCYIGKSIMPERKELCRNNTCPKLTTVWTTLDDLEIDFIDVKADKADYPYILCQREVLSQTDNKFVVLADPEHSQRTVTLTLDEDCWDNARSASADLIHRVATRYGWNMEFFISLLKSVDTTEGNYNKECHGAGSATLGEMFAEDMEYWAQENATVMHRLYYIVTQYINLVRSGITKVDNHV